MYPNQQNGKGNLTEVAKMLVQSKRTVVFTGSGISAESGIPTFRGPGGLWEKYNPEKVASIQGFKEDPEAFWKFARELMLKSKAEPNKAHYALAELEKDGPVSAIITQNIDMLHQRAGSSKVYELHGSMKEVECLECGKKYDWDTVAEELKENENKSPLCTNCGSPYLKPGIVFFGELLPDNVFLKADEEVRNCDLFMVVGSSLSVFPAADLPWIAKQYGARMVLINAQPTEQDHFFDVKLYGKAARILPGIVLKYRELKE